MTITGGINASPNYPVSPLATTQAIPAGATLQEEFTSLELYDNSQIELYKIGKGATPLLSTIINIGRQQNGGNFDSIGLTEQITTNFPDVKYKEEDDLQELFIITTGGNSAATTISFASTKGLYEGLILRNVTTNENVRISSVTNGTDIVIQRAVGTVVAATISTSDVMLVIGSAVSKGVARVGTAGVAAVDKFNYFQKHITTIELDDFDMMTNKVQNLNAADKMMKDKSIEHFRAIEKLALFGQKKAGTDANAKAYYTMEGVVQGAKRGWTDDISSSLTRGTLQEILGYPMRYTRGTGAPKKIALCGSKAKAKLSELFEGRLQVGQIENIDLKFNSIEIDTGEYMFINHPMLDENSGYDKHIIVIDPAYITLFYPSGNGMNGSFNGKTIFEFDKSASNRSHQEGSYFTIMTIVQAAVNAGGCFKIVA